MDNINNSSNNKNKKGIIIAITVIAVIAIAIAVFVVTGSKGRKLIKQLNLGQKYLTDMNYEEAVASFEKALEIDPMSADAYLGLADAYIGMGDLETAKSALEKGIEILGKAGADSSTLEAKLKEVEDEIARIAAEEEARRKAEEEEAKRKAEEERLAAMPYLELQPIFDAASDVWGRNWDAWTTADFIAEKGLHQDMANPNWYHDDNNIFSCDMDSRRLTQFNKSKIDNTYRGAKEVFIHDTEYRFVQDIYADTHLVIEDCLYTYAAERNLFTYDDVKTYFGFGGVSDSDLESGINVRSDLGDATVTSCKNDTNSAFTIYLGDIVIEFTNQSDSTAGRLFYITLSKK